MKGKGRMLSHGISELSIACLPDKVPPQIEVDISVLEELDQSLHVKDVVLDPDITVHDDPEQLLVKVTEITVKEEVVEEAAAEEEGEAAEGEAGAEAKAEEEPEAEAKAEE
jgi:large subunit ribosomal protein L25